jgi:hypothetical protein
MDNKNDDTKKIVTVSTVQQHFVSQAQNLLSERKKTFMWIEPSIMEPASTQLQQRAMAADIFEPRPHTSYIVADGVNVGIPDTIPDIPCFEQHRFVVTEGKILDLFDERPVGLFFLRIVAEKEKYFYTAAWFESADGMHFRFRQYVLLHIPFPCMVGMICSRICGRHMYFTNNRTPLVFVDTKRTRYEGQSIYMLTCANKLDPVLDYIMQQKPLTIEGTCVPDDGIPMLLPERILFIDAEAHTRKGCPEVWCVALVETYRTEVVWAEQYYLKECRDLTESIGIRPPVFTMSDEVRKIILDKQSKGCYLFAKGYMLEFMWMLRRCRGVKIRYYRHKDGYLIHSEKDYGFSRCYYEFAVHDLTCLKYDQIKHYYKDLIPPKWYNVAEKHYNYCKAGSAAHMPIVECCVFFVHWCSVQTRAFLDSHWDIWKDYYCLFRKTVPYVPDVDYWDSRVHWLGPPEHLGPFKKVVERLHAQRTYLRDQNQEKRKEMQISSYWYMNDRPQRPPLCDISGFDCDLDITHGMLGFHGITEDLVEKFLLIMNSQLTVEEKGPYWTQEKLNELSLKSMSELAKTLVSYSLYDVPPPYEDVYSRKLLDRKSDKEIDDT